MEIFLMPPFKKIILTPLLSGLSITLHQLKEVAMSQRPEPIILGSVEKRWHYVEKDLCHRVFFLVFLPTLA